jgi:hypothetical protein
VSPIDSRFSSLPPFPAVTRGTVFDAGAPVNNVVGSFSLGAFSSAVACLVFQSFDVLPLQVSSSSQSCISSSQSFSGVSELGRGCAPLLLCCRTLSRSRNIIGRLGKPEKCIWTRIFLLILWKL